MQKNFELNLMLHVQFRSDVDDCAASVFQHEKTWKCFGCLECDILEETSVDILASLELVKIMLSNYFSGDSFRIL